MDDAQSTAATRILHAVLSSGGRALDDLTLTADDFDLVEHEAIYSAMLEMRAAGRTVSQEALSLRLPKHADTIWSLDSAYAASVSVDHYAEILSHKSLVRRLRAVGAGLSGLDTTMTPDELVEYARGKVDAAVGAQATRPVEFMPELWDEALQPDVEGTVGSFLPSPWPAFDAATGGFRRGGLYIFGARPGVGKTVVALNIAMKLGNFGVVAYSSLEMGRDELTRRAIAAHADVDIEAIERRTLNPDQVAMVAASRRTFQTRVAIDDRAHMVGPAHVRQFARTVSRRGELSAIIVDYLQLMDVRGNADRRAKVTDFSRQLKVLAKDLNVPVIALSQLNRDSEKRMDKRPLISELRESGSIEQDADMVVLLSREEQQFGEEIILDIAKYRQGAQAVVTLGWRGDRARIDDYSPAGYANS